MNPVTGQFLGPNTAVFVGTLVPNSGDPRNALREAINRVVEELRGSPRSVTYATVLGYSLGPIIVEKRLHEIPSLPVIAAALALNAAIYAPFAWAARPTESAGQVAQEFRDPLHRSARVAPRADDEVERLPDLRRHDPG